MNVTWVSKILCQINNKKKEGKPTQQDEEITKSSQASGLDDNYSRCNLVEEACCLN